jgi:hypothetical protein
MDEDECVKKQLRELAKTRLAMRSAASLCSTNPLEWAMLKLFWTPDKWTGMAQALFRE